MQVQALIVRDHEIHTYAGKHLGPALQMLAILNTATTRNGQDALERRIDEVPLKCPSRDANTCEPTPSKRRKLDFPAFNSPERELNDEI